MHDSLQKLNLVKNKVNELISQKQVKTKPQIIVVTKTFPLSKITPLIVNGHIHFLLPATLVRQVKTDMDICCAMGCLQLRLC